MDLFLRSFGEGLEARMTGPGKGRFVLQATSGYGPRYSGRNQGCQTRAKPPSFGFFSRASPTLFVLKIGLKGIATPLAAGIVLDMILQWIIFKQFFLLPALIAGTIWVALPYSIARGLTIASPDDGTVRPK
jgi:hypothetical protein